MKSNRCSCNSPKPGSMWWLCLLCWGTGIRLNTRSDEPIDKEIARALAQRAKERR